MCVQKYGLARPFQATAYGDPSIVLAMMTLLREALADNSCSSFTFVSADSVPLVPAETLHAKAANMPLGVTWDGEDAESFRGHLKEAIGELGSCHVRKLPYEEAAM